MLSRRNSLGVGLFLLVACGRVIAASATCVDVIDPSIHYQTMDHFTASDCWSATRFAGWKLENREKVADLLFSSEKGIGLSAWRVNLGGGRINGRIRDPARKPDTYELSEGQYDWTRCEGSRWLLRAAKTRGVMEFIAFCNSPPARLTRNGLTCAETSVEVTNNLKPGMERQFGRYLADILSHFKNDADASERVNFQWVSPINEPQWDWTGGQEGTRASDADILRQYKAIDAELKRQSLSTRILGPESGSIPDMYKLSPGATRKYHANFGDYIDTFCGDPVLGQITDNTIGYHSYWSDGADDLVKHRQALRAKLDRFPNWRVFETEYCVMEPRRDLGMNTALRVARIIHSDLTIVNASGWAWWLAISNGNYKDGLLYTDWRRPGDVENVLASKTFWAFGNFSRFVRPGMVRLRLNTMSTAHDIDGVTGCAFGDPAGGVVAVYINSTDQDVLLSLTLSQVPAIRWTPYTTSEKDGDDLRKGDAVPSGNALNLPAKSVVTFVGRR